jgi:hypothetical protein
VDGLLAGGFKVCPDFYPNSLEEPLPMSRFASSKTLRIWAERVATCERANAPVARFGQSIGCSPTSFTQWKRTLAAKPQATAFLRVQTSDSTKDSIEIKLSEAGVRREGTAAYHSPHMSPSRRLEVLGVRLSPAAYAHRQFLCRPPGF